MITYRYKYYYSCLLHPNVNIILGLHLHNIRNKYLLIIFKLLISIIEYNLNLGLLNIYYYFQDRYLYIINSSMFFKNIFTIF